MQAEPPIRDERASNPFTPVFGKMPAHMAGRRQVIDAITQALDDGSNSPDIASLLVGARGTGKTALLTYLSLEAQRRGWVCADVTAAPGMLEEVLQQSERNAGHLLEPKGSARRTGVQVGGVLGAQWEHSGEAPMSWRIRMAELIDSLSQANAGLLITIDEANPRIDELRQLVETFQHFIREERKVALIMAGLPHTVSLLVTKSSTTFMRRAARHNLGPIQDYEVEEAFRLTIEQAGRTASPEALEEAVRAIAGFPFMFQLVGYRAWNVAPGAGEISVDDMRVGIRLAKTELKDRVYDATLAELAPGDIAFLQAMLADNGPSSQADIRSRLKKSSSHVSTYKRRLQDQGIIDEPRRGVLCFCLPGFREYLEESVAM